LINTDFSNAQEELLTVPSRIHAEQSLRTFSSWGDSPIYNTIRESFVYNLDLRKFETEGIIEKPYIIDNNDNKAFVPSYTTNVRYLHRLFSDNTIKVLTKYGWEVSYQRDSKIVKYYLKHTPTGLPSDLASITLIITLSIDGNLVIDNSYGNLTTVSIGNVSNFWAGKFSSYNYYVFTLINNNLYCYTTSASDAARVSGCNKTSAQHTLYSFIPVYQYPSNIRTIVTGYRNSAIITEYSIIESEYDGSKSTFTLEHVFSSKIKDSYIIDTMGSTLASSASWYVLLENGELWTKGDNTYGQLGLNSDDTYIEDWTKVDRLFDQISVGYYIIYSNISSGKAVRLNTFVYGTDKQTSYVYAWGSSTNRYPLGIDSTSKVTVPTLILSVPVIKMRSTEMPIDGITPTIWTTYIYAGGLFLSRDNSVYIVGNSYYPALGDYGGALQASLADIKNVRKLRINEPITDIYIQSNGHLPSTTTPYSARNYIGALLIAESGNLYSLNSLTQYYFNRVL
jgi:hypothetical protein